MTIKFTVKHHYKDIPIEITVEAETLKDLNHEIEQAMHWVVVCRTQIRDMHEALHKLTADTESKEQNP